MTTWATVYNNAATEVVMVDPRTIFHADLATHFTVVPDGTETGATYANGVWTNPPAVAPVTAPVVYPLLTPMQFYLAFAPKERMLLKALANTGLPANSPLVSPTNATAIPVDPVIAEFWATFEIAQQLNSHIDPNLTSVQEGLAYIAAPTSPTPAVIASARIPQILAGIAQ